MKRFAVSFLIAVVALSLCGCGKRKRAVVGQTGPERTPTVRRAAFDIGSGSTKLRIADVMLGGEGVINASRLEEGAEHLRVDYEADLNNSPGLDFSEKIMKKGIEALKSLKAKAELLGARQFSAVASGAFRRARNAKAFARRIEKETGIPVHILSRRREAELSFLAVEDDWDFPSGRLVLWDIGGANSAFLDVDAGNVLNVYESSLASVDLRDTVVRAIQGRDSSVGSPNPMSAADVGAVLRLVEREAGTSMPSALIDKLSRKQTIVVGVGPVHFYSILGRIGQEDAGRNTYSREQVEKLLKQSTGKTDAQIGGAYADTDVVNLCLVLGFMKALGIDRVRVAPVNLADGVLESAAYW